MGTPEHIFEQGLQIGLRSACDLDHTQHIVNTLKKINPIVNQNHHLSQFKNQYCRQSSNESCSWHLTPRDYSYNF